MVKYKMNEHKLSNYFYILPIVALILFLFMYPVAYAIYISFTNFSLYHFFKYSLVGFQNYVLVLTSHTFLHILGNTALWTVGSLVPMMALGYLMALVLNQKDIRGKRLFFTLMLFPWAFPAYISLLVWLGMWNYEYGVVNKIIGLIHLAPINWLTYPDTAWIALILTNVWLSFPYYTAIFLSSLQSIPTELYEAAEVDGASMWQKFGRITLPMMKTSISFVGISGFIFTWNNFYPIYLLTGGGPGESTNILIVYAYQEAFAYNLYDIAAAYSTISTIILAIMAIIMLKITHVLEVVS